MSFPKIFAIVLLCLICAISIAFFVKKNKTSQLLMETEAQLSQPIELPLQDKEEEPIIFVENVEPAPQPITPLYFTDDEDQDETESIDRIQEFFNKQSPQLPIVQTITYKSKVAWQKGRPAWLADYASHYKTSRHFIARSLNGKPDYEKQNVADGDKINVFREDKDFQFYLIVDLDKAKMRFYYIDNGSGEKVLLKTYSAGVGRPDGSTPSKSRTPVGKFALGEKVAIFKPKSTGIYQGEKTELIRVFGTRWIPFGPSLDDPNFDSKGLGIHGLPWVSNEKGELVEDTSGLGKKSDGCIRLGTKDMEELFAIIITRPTTIELVTQAMPRERG